MCSDVRVTRHQGLLAEWDDERGFGFITPDGGGRRVFVHVSAFPRGQRPVLRDRVTYDLRTDERNRLRATAVQYTVRRRSRPAGRRGLGVALAVVVLFFALLGVLVALDRAPAWLFAPYGVFSLMAFVMYQADKSAAVGGRWRVPESNLLAVGLVGGWPGALVAQRAFRHKTTKQPFRTAFWCSVAANLAVLGFLLLARGLH